MMYLDSMAAIMPWSICSKDSKDGIAAAWGGRAAALDSLALGLGFVPVDGRQISKFDSSSLIRESLNKQSRLRI